MSDVESEAEKELRLTKADHAHTGVRAFFSAIPIVGSPIEIIFGKYYPAPIDERRDKLLVSVADGIIDALEDVGKAFSKLLDTSASATEKLLQMFVWGIIISALAGVAFTVVKSSVEGNYAAETAVDAGEAVYDFGSFVQDVIEYGKWIGAIGAAGFGVYLAVKTLLRRANLID